MGKSEIIMKHRRNEGWRKSWKNMKTAWKRILPARIKVMDHMGRQQVWVRQAAMLPEGQGRAADGQNACNLFQEDYV